MNKQQGSAHVIVVGVLVVALIGALGFIFWQNFIQKDDVATVAKTTETKTTEQPSVGEKKLSTKLYDADGFTFEYPSDGWKAVQASDNSDGSNDNPTVWTTDYVPSQGMGIDSGAYVAVYDGPPNSTVEEAKQNVIQTFNATDMKDMTVAGVSAISYRLDYEGTRYSTYFIKAGVSYTIVYQYAGTDPLVHRNGYDTVVESFKFK